MTLKSIEVSRREEEQAKLKKQQKFQMELDRIESVNENYNTSRSSTNDKYMISALKRVKKSDVTLDEDLTRMNGNFLFNRNINPTRKVTLEKTISDLHNRQSIEDRNDYDRTINSLELIKNYGSSKDFLVMESLTKRHNENGQLGVRDKKIRDGLYEKYSQELKSYDVSFKLCHTTIIAFRLLLLILTHFIIYENVNDT